MFNSYDVAGYAILNLQTLKLQLKPKKYTIESKSLFKIYAVSESIY